MVDSLIALDRQIFLSINSLPHPPLLDALGLLFSFLGAFGLVWFLLALWLVIRDKAIDRSFIQAMFLAGLLSLIFVSIVFKPLIHRNRPDVKLGDQVTVVTTTIFSETLNDTYAFPSGHTTIAFASAYILSRKKRGARLLFFILAVIIAFTRIYLGKHYPFDVLAGIILGLSIGWFSVLVTSGGGKKGFQSA